MQTVYSSAGIAVTSLAGSGYRLSSRSIITSTGTSTYTPPSGVAVIIVECVGGGSGGRNATGNAGQIALGGGGGGGGYSSDVIWVRPGHVFTAVVNVGGTADNAGGATSFSSVNPTVTLVAAAGGTTGSALVTGSTETIVTGGLGGALGSAVGAVQVQGNSGLSAHRVSGTIGCSGAGGAGPWGGGPPARITQGNGAAGGNYGAGGSGAFSINAGGATTGGHGGQGVIIVWEFI